MPSHVWVRLDTWDDESPVAVEVIRRLSDHDVQPTNDEYPDADSYEWKKSFKDYKKLQITTFGQKGYW